MGVSNFSGERIDVETYDILMLIVLVAAVVFGALKGFAWQLASFASITVSYIVAYRYRMPFSESINADPPWNRFLAMLILYVGTSLVIWTAFRMLSNSIDRLKLKEFDRQVGAVFGFGKGVLYCTLITLFAVTLLGPEISNKIVRSKSGYYIANVLDRSNLIMPSDVHEVIGPYIERFDQQVRAAENAPAQNRSRLWGEEHGRFDGATPRDTLWQESPAEEGSQPWLPIDRAQQIDRVQQALQRTGGAASSRR